MSVSLGVARCRVYVRRCRDDFWGSLDAGRNSGARGTKALMAEVAGVLQVLVGLGCHLED